jgi:ferrous iron transport protein A
MRVQMPRVPVRGRTASVGSHRAIGSDHSTSSHLSFGSHDQCRLTEIPCGVAVVIRDLAASGRDDAVDAGRIRRLRDLGLTPGTTVTVERRAPLRGPLQLRFRDSAMCLRRCEAELVMVEAASVPAPGEAADSARGETECANRVEADDPGHGEAAAR